MFGHCPQVSLFKKGPVVPVSSPAVVKPLFARQMIQTRRFALIRDQFLGRPITDLDTAPSIDRLSFVFINSTAYLLASVSWPFTCTSTTEVVGAI